MAEKVWLVTGASRGFGAEIAKAALAAGDKVIATARKVKGLKGSLGGGDRILAVKMDVTKEDKVRASVNEGLEHFGRIDVLVNNAGFGLLGAVEEASADEVKEIYKTNVFGLLNVTRAVLPIFRKQRSGHVINISSVGGYNSAPGWGIYASTKFAVEGISESLYDELAPLGIHVTVVEPGYFRTDFLDRTSLQHTENRIEDYAETVGKMRELAVERNHAQVGDPKKLGSALLQIVNAAEPPLRLPLGSDTLERVAAKNKFVEEEIAKWRELSSSTDFEEKASAAGGSE
jgi:NAD(P)-dependent dehydrogenase (short-subunit alcohol dehydrogenase family)